LLTAPAPPSPTLSSAPTHAGHTHLTPAIPGTNGNPHIAKGAAQRRLYFRYPFIGNIQAQL
ncbi:hypothetical protein AIZ14_25995, partial [Salmonella enterica subsp. enterica serovar Typhimurium]